jgi:hypothetical protein
MSSGRRQREVEAGADPIGECRGALVRQLDHRPDADRGAPRARCPRSWYGPAPAGCCWTLGRPRGCSVSEASAASGTSLVCHARWSGGAWTRRPHPRSGSLTRSCVRARGEGSTRPPTRRRGNAWGPDQASVAAVRWAPRTSGSQLPLRSCHSRLNHTSRLQDDQFACALGAPQASSARAPLRRPPLTFGLRCPHQATGRRNDNDRSASWLVPG